MAAEFNKTILVGRLGFDPELKKLSSGTAVATLSLASNRSWVAKDGEMKQDVLWIDCEVWDRTAEAACRNLRKGSQILVEGHLKMDQWEDKTTGERRSKIKLNAERVVYLDGKPPEGDDRGDRRGGGGRGYSGRGEQRGGGGGGYSGRGDEGRREAQAAPTRPTRNYTQAEVDADQDDDIPF